MNDLKKIFTEKSSITLDLIRIIAAQMVLIGHAISYVGIAPWIQPPRFAWIQNIGVVIFFILSGILTSMSLFNKISEKKKGTYNFKLFTIERFSRIYSGYLPALMIIAFIDGFVIFIIQTPDRYNAYNLFYFITNIFMLQDDRRIDDRFFHTTFFGSTSFGTGRPLWTLPVEWWLYLFFGFYMLKKKIVKVKILNKLIYYSILILFISMALIKYPLVLSWMAGVVITIVLRLAFTIKRKTQNNNFPIQTADSSDHRSNKKLRASNIHPITYLAISIIFFTFSILRAYELHEAYEAVFIFFLITGFFFLLLYTNLTNRHFSEKTKKTCRWLASYTMTLYLIHYTILDYLFVYVSPYVSPMAYLFLSLVISNIIAIILAHYTEKKHLVLRNYLSSHLIKQEYAIQIESGQEIPEKKNNVSLPILKGFVAAALTIIVSIMVGIDSVSICIFGSIVGIMVWGIENLRNKAVANTNTLR